MKIKNDFNNEVVDDTTGEVYSTITWSWKAKVFDAEDGKTYEWSGAFQARSLSSAESFIRTKKFPQPRYKIESLLLTPKWIGKGSAYTAPTLIGEYPVLGTSTTSATTENIKPMVDVPYTYGEPKSTISLKSLPCFKDMYFGYWTHQNLHKFYDCTGLVNEFTTKE